MVKETLNLVTEEFLGPLYIFGGFFLRSTFKLCIYSMNLQIFAVF